MSVVFLRKYKTGFDPKGFSELLALERVDDNHDQVLMKKFIRPAIDVKLPRKYTERF